MYCRSCFLFDVAKFVRIGVQYLSGDHGPYLTGNCTNLTSKFEGQTSRLEIQDRVGTFLAVHWPPDMGPEHEPAVLQDILPLVLTQISGEMQLWEAVWRTLGQD